MPYPRRLLWDILPQNTPNSQNLLLRRASHGFHRFTQILRARCSPTEFTEFTEFGSVGMAGMPYPPTSVNIRVICGRFFSARSFCAFRAFCGNIFSPTDFTDLHRCEGAFKGVHLSQVHQPSKKCTNRAIGTFCFVGAVLALASGKAERRQLHQLDWQRGYGRDAIPSYICAHPCSSVGGSSLPEVSVCSVRSVGISFLPRISQIYTDA